MASHQPIHHLLLQVSLVSGPQLVAVNNYRNNCLQLVTIAEHFSISKNFFAFAYLFISPGVCTGPLSSIWNMFSPINPFHQPSAIRNSVDRSSKTVSICPHLSVWNNSALTFTLSSKLWEWAASSRGASRWRWIAEASSAGTTHKFITLSLSVSLYIDLQHEGEWIVEMHGPGCLP